MLKKIFIIIVLGLSIFSTENTFSSTNTIKQNCDQKIDPFCVKSKSTDDIKGISGEKKLDSLVNGGIKYLLGFLLLISVLYGMYGAWNIFSAMQDDDKVKKGKTIILRACIGLTVIFSAYMITDFVIRGVLFGEKIGTSSQNTTTP